MTIANNKNYSDLHALSVGIDEIVILRSDEPLTRAMYENMHKAFREATPGWRGMVLVMGLDQSLEKMTPTAVYDLYQALKLKFEKTEEWAKMSEADTLHCVRCGQELKTTDQVDHD